MNLSPAKRNLLITAFIFILNGTAFNEIVFYNKISPNIGILLKGLLRPRLLSNPFASCFLINLDF